MIYSLLEIVASFVVHVIQATGYLGITILMTLGSFNIPIPSEIILPFSGFLVFEEKLNFFGVLFFGLLGDFIGAWLSYLLGYFGGRPFFVKFGKLFFLRETDLKFANSFFQKYGMSAIFLGRVLPVIRTFISFPAGIAKMNKLKFSLYTFAGSFVWSSILIYSGMVAGTNWKILGSFVRKFDWAILFILGALAAWWIWRHVKQNHSKVI